MRRRGFVLMVPPFVTSVGAALAEPPAPERHLVENIRNTLLRLPYYGMFDFVAFSYDKGTVILSGMPTARS